MHFNGSFSFSSLVLLGLLSLQAHSKDAPLTVTLPSKTTAPTATPPSSTQPGPTLFGMTKKPEGVGAAQTKEEEPVKPIAPKPAWVPDDRKTCTITIKPLSINLTALTFGMSKKHQKINGFDLNVYRSTFGYMANRTERAGIGYDFEIGVMATKNVELFTILGLSHERPFEKVTVMYPPITPPFTQTNAAFDCKPRDNYEVSLGGRYYWNTQKPWFPFVGIMGTATFQGPVKADVFNVNPTGIITVDYQPLGSLTLQGRKTLWGGTLQFGSDYQFNKNFSLTFCAGLRYTPRPATTYTSIGGVPISFRDNQSIWSLPVLVALKLTI